MNNRFLSIENVLKVLFVACLVLLLMLYVQKYDNSIQWKVTSQAEIEEISGYQFTKGPFEFGLPGHRVSIVESFSAGPIERFFETERALLILSFIGLALLLGVVSYLPGFWFYAAIGLYIFMLMGLDVGSVGFMGFSVFSKWGTLLIIGGLVIPAYLFNSFFKNVSFFLRILIFLIIGAVFSFFSGVDPLLFQEQMAIGGYVGFAVLTFLYLLIIAEENVFGLLYLITKSRGGKNNEKHFAAFGLVYLGIVGLAYANKAGFIRVESNFFDPYVLFAISSLVAIWSIRHKSSLYHQIIAPHQAQALLLSTGVAVFSFLGYNFFRGNDPYFEAFHYLIIYTHLGFGVLFFLYIISNFVNPLIGGHQIYKIVYQSRNLPYSTMRLAGLAAIAAFFFLSNKEPLELLQGGRLNLLGAKTQLEGNEKLAMDYFRKGKVSAYDNHFSNYHLGYYELQRSNYKDANKRFGRATLRYPSAQSYVNESSTYSLLGEVTPSLISLKKGLTDFPDEPHILNNLGLTYLGLNEPDSAQKYFMRAESRGNALKTSEVNYWRALEAYNLDSIMIIDAFQHTSTPLKANVLAKLLEVNQEVSSIKFTSPGKSFAMHKIAYLINSGFYFEEDSVLSLLNQSLTETTDASLYETASHDLAIMHLRHGNIYAALQSLDQLQSQANSSKKGEILNEMGLVALSQHAPEVAYTFFQKAQGYNYEPARFNMVIALLEQGLFGQAEALTKQLVDIDGSLADFQNDLMSMAKHADGSAGVLHLYYKYEEYSFDELEALVGQMSVDFANSLLNKIFSEQYGSENTIIKYIDLFRNHISTRLFENILNNNLSEAQMTSGLQNPLNAPLFLASLTSIRDREEAYNLLSSAIDMNPYNADLMKAFVLRAADLGLKEFAYSGLNKLKGLILSSEYLEFEQGIEEKFKPQEDSW